jgi:hypothetical protein
VFSKNRVNCARAGEGSLEVGLTLEMVKAKASVRYDIGIPLVPLRYCGGVKGTLQVLSILNNLQQL